ncbi:Sister chromatid cohesion protein 2 [Coemansia erecta]|uniref:Sister chromatid cohesion protein n=1 Tax=Coemansia erecta TaxID=147472 RepID=A0A9W7XZA3_9FUNG|nr:Sister chromatid cohesion protein 2 [Coemansia erecta]
MQYRGIVGGELALDSDFERLSLVDRDSSLQAEVHGLVSEAFTSDAIQKLQLKKHPTALTQDARYMRSYLDSSIENMTIHHPSILSTDKGKYLSVEKPDDLPSVEDGYARLMSYIQRSKSLHTEEVKKEPSLKEPMADSDSDDDDELDDQPLISLVKRIKKRKQESKSTLTHDQDVSSETSGKRQRADTDSSVHDRRGSTDGAVSDTRQPIDSKSSEPIQRPTDILDDYLTLMFQEEDHLADVRDGDDNSKHVYFRRIRQDHSSSYVLSKRSLRRIRALVAPCTPIDLAESIPDDIVSRLVGLLVSAVETADGMGLATMIKDGSELDKDVELSSEFCDRLDQVFSVSCLGLEAASLIIDLAATGKASKTACTGDSLHTATSFFKECLISCIVPILALTLGSNLVEAFSSKELPLSNRLHAFFSNVLLVHEPVVVLVGQPALAEQDIIALVFAAISVTFCTSELLGSCIDANVFESIRRSAQSLLRQVFESHVDQRSWMLEEILASLIRLPTQKRAMNSYRIAGGKSVQFITVLLLKLLQGTAHLPEDLTAGFESDTLSPKEYRMLLQKHKKAVDTASSSADFTVRYLIGRCLKRDVKAVSNEAEYRVLLEAFVDDCIVLLGHPQWPAAELVIRIYSLHILDLLDEEKSDISMKTLALDSAAHIASHIARTRQEIKAVSSTHSGRILQAVTPALSLELIEDFQAQSTILLAYLQSKAVAGESTGAIPLYISSWSTMLVAALLKIRGRAATPGSADETNAATSATGEESMDTDDDTGSDTTDESDDDMEDASDSGSDYEGSSPTGRKSKTKDKPKVPGAAEKRKAIQGCLRSYMDITHRSTKALPDNVTYANALEAAKSIISLLPLYRSFDMLLTRVVMALSASQVTLRSKALRSLNQIASQRPSVLYQANVKYAINHRLQDSSPQVREAAIDLIGRHISQNPELTDQYYDFISVRVLDKGPSVRKRVLRILREIYLSSSNLTQLVDIGVRILQRTGDDERSIRELTFKTLQELWFTSGEHTVVEDEDGVRGEATGNTFNLLTPDSQRDMLKRVRVMTGVMEATRSRELSELMAGLFDYATSKTTNPEAEDALLVVRCVIDALFEQLLRSEESSAESTAEGNTSVSGGTVSSVSVFSTAACFRFISALSRIAPDAVGQHSEMLSIYLKSTSAADEDMVYNVLDIFNNTLLSIPHPSAHFLSSLESDLISLLSSSPQGILTIAVPCLCTLIDKITWNYAKLIRLFRSCALQLYREHKRAASGSTAGAMTPKNLMRFIMLAGLTCRHFDFDKCREEQSEHFKDLDQVISATVPEFMNDMFLSFAKSSPSLPVQLAAVQMLGQIYIKQPQLALEPRSRALMDSVFASGSPGHKLQVVRNFLEFLRADAKRYAERLKDEKGKVREVDAKALVGDTGDMSVAGVGASLMQTYLDRIIDSTFLPGAALLRASGFEVISLVLEQGLAHPLKCVPALIALGTSGDAYIRNKALKLHQDLCFKYASFIHSRDIEGVRLAYEFQMQIRGKPEDVVGYNDTADIRDTSDRPVAYLQPLYSQLRSKRVRRNEFLSLLVRIGDFDSGLSYGANQSSTGTGNADVAFTRFVAENLAALDYKYLDEVLHVIYQISAVIAGTGLNIYHQFESGLHPGSVGSTAPECARLTRATEASACIGILFALREFLKAYYNISESRCTAYNPSDTSGARDKPVTWHAQSSGDGSGGGGAQRRGQIVWGAHNPYAVQRMVSEQDYSNQRAQYLRLMAGSLAVGEESPAIGGGNRSFGDDADKGGDGNRDGDGDGAPLDPEELELLTMHDLDEA